MLSLLPILLLISTVFASEGLTREKHRGVVKRATTYTKKYTSLVAFGASYQDNAHERDSQYKQYQRGWPYAGGRFTNGAVAVEHIRASLKVPLYDYAYGGAVVVNDDIASAGVPAVSDQVSQYLSDVGGNKVARGKGRALHVFWAGINDVSGIWGGYRKTGNKQNAMKNVVTHAERLIDEARRVQAGATRGVDLLILPLPPLEIIPNLIAQSSNKADLATLKEFVTAYNVSLQRGIAALQKTGGSRSRVFTYNVQKWWYNAIQNPGRIGVSNVKDACYNQSTQKICPNPAAYFYYDTLHPTTTTFKSLAKAIFAAI